MHEGFRVIGTDRVPEYQADGTPRLNATTGRQVMGRSVVVRRLNRRWAQVKVPGCGWVRFRLSARGRGARLPDAKTFRVTSRNGQWHAAFAVLPDPVPAPGTGETVGIDRGITITTALSDGRKLNCPQLTTRERAQIRKHQRRTARAPRGSEKKAAGYAKPFAPGRLTEPGREAGVLGGGEVLEGLLLHVGVPGRQPLVVTPGRGELTALLGETERGPAAAPPVRMLLHGQVPHIPRVRTVQQHLPLLLARRVHPKPCHAPKRRPHVPRPRAPSITITHASDHTPPATSRRCRVPRLPVAGTRPWPPLAIPDDDGGSP